MEKERLNAVHDYAVRLAAVLTSDFFRKQEHVTGHDLVDFTPIKQINLFMVRRLYETWQKEARNIQSPYFDYKAEPVRKAFNQLMSELSKHISIGKATFEPLLAQAIADTITFTIYPGRFFEKFLAEMPERILIASHWNQQVKYLKTHAAVIARLNREIAQDRTEISRGAAIDITRRVLQTANSSLESPHDLVAALSELLPVGIYELAPEWKDQNELLETDKTASENFFGANPTLFEEEEPVAPAYTPPPAPTISTRPTLPTEEEIRQKQQQIAQRQENGAIPPTPKPVEQVRNFPDIPQPVTPKVTPAPVPGQKKEEGEKTLLDKLREQAAQNQPASSSGGNLLEKFAKKDSKSLKGGISLGQRLTFIKALFKDDAEEYNRAIELIDNCPDYHQAIGLIKERFFVRYQWDLSSEPTKDFLRLVSEKFG